MNAVMREHYEVPVVANETIESNFGFLRTSVDEVKANVRVLQADNTSIREKIDATRSELVNLVVQARAELGNRIDQVRSELVNRIDQVRTELGERIDQFRAELGTRMDKLDGRMDKLDSKIDRVEAGQRTLRENLEKKIEEGDKALGEKIDLLSSKLGDTNVSVAKVATMQKAMLWVIGSLTSAVVLFSVVFQAGIHFHWW